MNAWRRPGRGRRWPSERRTGAERARRELVATGETVRKRSTDTRDSPHRAGGADRTPRRRGLLEHRARRTTLHQSVDSPRIVDPSHTRKTLGLVPGISVDAGPPSGEHRVPTLGDGMQPRLRGRRSECGALDDLLARVRTGQSRVLVLRGEAGIGKTALLDWLAGNAPDFRIVRAAGVESEMELAYAGLHQLCAPFADQIDSLPGPQQDALGIAFGRRDGDAPNRFIVGLAVLGLLSEVAEEQSLLWMVDDAQWLDAASSQTLAFVARRLEAESVAMVVAMRDHEREDDFVRLDELVVSGLEERDAHSLLATVLTGPLDDRVRDRLVAETRGNPLALLELPRGLTPAEMAGGFSLPHASSLTSRIEESFRRRLAPLPPSTRTLLLVASAEPIGDPVPVW